MKILFIGYTVNEQLSEKLSGSSVAGNKMQLNLLKRLVGNMTLDIKTLTILPLAPFPKEKSVYVKKSKIKLFDEYEATQIAYFNIPVIKQIHQTLSVFYSAKRIIDNETIIFGFNLFPQIGLPLKWLKRKYGCKTIALLADLPIDDRKGRSISSFILRSIFDYFTRESIKACDKLIVLNKNAALKYGPDKDYIVVEGGVDLNDYEFYPSRINKNHRNIIYSGALTEYSGIRNIVDSMRYVSNNDVCLHIYGTGELEKYVKNASKENSNVFYMGKVSNQKMMQLQREAYLLVNPRSPDDPIADVTFPSKIFEYMLSGTPILTTKLSGLTDEYLENMFVFDSNLPRDIAKKIDEVMQLSIYVLRLKAESARNFVLDKKNWDIQFLKIEKFIES